MKKSFSPKEYIFLSLILLLSSACRETVHWQAAVPEKGEVGAHALPDTIAPVSAPFDFPDMEKSVFPDFAVSIADYGVVSGEKVTEAINRAIRDVHERGGGMVIVPSGIWLTGRIVLLSDVNLHLSEGAELHFSGVVADYQPAVFTRQEGVEVYSLGALVYADGQENIALTGKGKLVGPARDCEIQKRHRKSHRCFFSGREPCLRWEERRRSVLAHVLFSYSLSAGLCRRCYIREYAVLECRTRLLRRCRDTGYHGTFRKDSSRRWHRHRIISECVDRILYVELW